MLIRQTASGWEVADADGNVLTTCSTYDEGLRFISGALSFAQAATVGQGDPGSDTLLPETWMSDQGICFSENTPGGRDFSQCAWSWRDPALSLLPLMLQTETEIGHFGAELAGFMQELHMVGTTPQASGRFYNTDTGRAARDLIADGRRFGVSVDPTEAVDVEFVCTEEDQDGYCVDGVARFNAYEIGGLTMTPFPCFATASIITAPTTVMADAGTRFTTGIADGIAAGSSARISSSIGWPAGTPITDMERETARLVAAARTAVDDRPTAPPRHAFEIAEPALGVDFALGSLGDEWLVDQGDGHLAMPFEIWEDTRQVAGHLAYWGQCHVGYANQCVSPPESDSAYAHFHVGETLCADGTRVPTGSLTASCDHALTRLRAREAQDHYAHNGIAWANVRISNGVYGPWVCGTLRDDVTPEQVAVLRGGALSGDWRRLGGHLELIAGLAVTTPGFPIAREAMVASGMEIPTAPALASRSVNGEIEALVASAIVRRCPDCARRAAQAATQPRTALKPGTGTGEADARLARVEALVATIERRTRHLNGQAAASMAAQITATRTRD